MFRELAGLISRNGKILLAVWVVLLLMAVPPAFKAIDEMGYGISDMADSDSESAIGEEILLSYFDTAVHDAGRTPLIVVSYDSRDGYRQLQGDEEEGIPSFVEYLRKSLQEDKDWSGKLSFDDGAGIVSRAYGDQSSGALLIVLPYVSAYSEDYVIEDTSNLREKISDAMDLFMYELYESEPFFEVYVTGDPALAYDMASEASLSLAVMVLILIGDDRAVLRIRSLVLHRHVFDGCIHHSNCGGDFRVLQPHRGVLRPGIPGDAGSHVHILRP